MKPAWSMLTIGGHVYTLAFHPLDPTRLAIGCGDNLIRIWQTAAVNPYLIETFWKGIQARVLSVAWHPTQEALLAFGLEDGVVGVYHVLSHKYTISKTSHVGAVDNVVWAPIDIKLPGVSHLFSG